MARSVYRITGTVLHSMLRCQDSDGHLPSVYSWLQLGSSVAICLSITMDIGTLRRKCWVSVLMVIVATIQGVLSRPSSASHGACLCIGSESWRTGLGGFMQSVDGNGLAALFFANARKKCLRHLRQARLSCEWTLWADGSESSKTCVY